jgi:hypothetical protein
VSTWQWVFAITSAWLGVSLLVTPLIGRCLKQTAEKQTAPQETFKMLNGLKELPDLDPVQQARVIRTLQAVTEGMCNYADLLESQRIRARSGPEALREFANAINTVLFLKDLPPV